MAYCWSCRLELSRGRTHWRRVDGFSRRARVSSVALRFRDDVACHPCEPFTKCRVDCENALVRLVRGARVAYSLTKAFCSKSQRSVLAEAASALARMRASPAV